MKSKSLYAGAVLALMAAILAMEIMMRNAFALAINKVLAPIETDS